MQEAVKQEPVKSEPVAEPAHEEGGHSGSFTVEEMWTQSSGPVRLVLGTLLFMLVAAMGVGLERLITLQSARTQSRRLARGSKSPILRFLAICSEKTSLRSPGACSR